MICSLYVAKIALQQAKRANKQVHPFINLQAKVVSPAAIDGGEENPSTTNEETCADSRISTRKTSLNPTKEDVGKSSPTTTECIIPKLQGFDTNPTPPGSRQSSNRSPFRILPARENIQTRPKNLSIPFNHSACHFLLETQKGNTFTKKHKKETTEKEETEHINWNQNTCIQVSNKSRKENNPKFKGMNQTKTKRTKTSVSDENVGINVTTNNKNTHEGSSTVNAISFKCRQLRNVSKFKRTFPHATTTRRSTQHLQKVIPRIGKK